MLDRAAATCDPPELSARSGRMSGVECEQTAPPTLGRAESIGFFSEPTTLFFEKSLTRGWRPTRW
jgi:hypothetical protein